jgi:hypothetical protein
MAPVAEGCAVGFLEPEERSVYPPLNVMNFNALSASTENTFI